MAQEVVKWLVGETKFPLSQQFALFVFLSSAETILWNSVFVQVAESFVLLLSLVTLLLSASSSVHRFGIEIVSNVLSWILVIFKWILLLSDLVIFGHTFSICFFWRAVAVLVSMFWSGICWDLKGRQEIKSRWKSSRVPSWHLGPPPWQATAYYHLQPM